MSLIIVKLFTVHKWSNKLQLTFSYVYLQICWNECHAKGVSAQNTWHKRAGSLQLIAVKENSNGQEYISMK